MVAVSSLRIVCPLGPEARQDLRQAMIFEAGKWDPQHAEGGALAPYALAMDAAEWGQLAALAESMAEELLAAESALLGRPDLWKALDLPGSFVRGLRRGAERCPRRDARSSGPRGVSGPQAGPPGPRVVRFDFHPTVDGWRISEANTDVPGGFIEAAWLPRLVLRLGLGSGLRSCGEPGKALAEALAEALARAIVPDALGALPAPEARPGPAVVAMLHATAYVDDRQVMEHLAGELEVAGLSPVLAAPDAVSTHASGALRLRQGDRAWPVAAVVRFYPGEWLGLLPHGTGWPALAAAELPQCNPPSSLLIQSKRVPLLARAGALPPMPTFLSLLPETQEVIDVKSLDDQWVIKPALGRVGDGVVVAGATPAREAEQVQRALRWSGRSFVAQRRFESLAVETPDGPRHVCIGVFTVGGRAAGAYGRVASRPRIDAQSQDVAVLIHDGEATASQRTAAATEYSPP